MTRFRLKSLSNSFGTFSEGELPTVEAGKVITRIFTSSHLPTLIVSVWLTRPNLFWASAIKSLFLVNKLILNATIEFII